jgi:hypothetical protein
MSNTKTIDAFTKNFSSYFEEPLFSTDSDKVAMRIAKHLGPDFCMSSKNSNHYFHRKITKLEIDFFNNVISSLNLNKVPSDLEYFERDFKNKDEKLSDCVLIEQLIKESEAEKKDAIIKQIELEEEVREKYRYRSY